MPLPRPILLALLGAVLVGAAFFATRGSGDSASEDSSSGLVPPAPEPDATAPPRGKDKAPATTEAREAFAGAPVVSSGTFNLTASAKGLKLTGEGRFQSKGPAEPPMFQIDLTGKAGGQSLAVGAVSDGKSGYLVQGDKAVLVPKKGWDALTGVRADQAKGASSKEDFSGYSAQTLNAFKLRGQETLDGTAVLHFRAPIAVGEIREDFRNMATLFKQTSLPSALPRQVANTAKGGTRDVWVGVQDHVVRREWDTIRYAGGTFALDFRRANINEPQKISAPKGASTKSPTAAGWQRDAFGLAFSAFAVGVLTVEPSTQDDTPKPAKSEPQPAPKRDDRARPKRDRAPAKRNVVTTPAQVKRAVGQRKVVILFFRQRGADDDAVASAVNSQRGRKNVAVFILPVGQAPKYEQFGGNSVVRAPSIILLGRGGQPRLFEGFIDTATLAQAVTDSR
jgi:hypothetical protein